MTAPVFVIARLFVEESDVGVIALQVRSDVPETADNAVVGTVKLLVYNVVPLIIRRFEIKPVK